ncbi:hypothetical protein QBC37DRAFT_153842 [Rhypophila decipiens]|uniref:Secreted protein n=1 Tax=Rhypophila decipiens TaxID=261697 RepID=A0AAN7BCZ3_9PEZI|nr:hypothetical protein QBC37DRAFT_153842 [Rhypophila decipiens]
MIVAVVRAELLTSAWALEVCLARLPYDAGRSDLGSPFSDCFLVATGAFFRQQQTKGRPCFFRRGGNWVSNVNLQAMQALRVTNCRSCGAHGDGLIVVLLDGGWRHWGLDQNREYLESGGRKS